MSRSDSARQLLHEELIARVSALDGKQCEIENNRKTLSATIEALVECTDVEPSTISSIADRLSVDSRFFSAESPLTAEELQLEKNTRIARYCAIAAVALFTFSLLKWFHVSSDIKSVMHEVSQVQSKVADFRLRTGRYPHAFDNIGYGNGAPGFETIEKVQMGPQGQLLIDSSGWISHQMLLTPTETLGGQSTWRCSTDASWLFMLTSWVCGYQSSLEFRHSKS